MTAALPLGIIGLDLLVLMISSGTYSWTVDVFECLSSTSLIGLLPLGKWSTVVHASSSTPSPLGISPISLLGKVLEQRSLKNSYSRTTAKLAPLTPVSSGAWADVAGFLINLDFD